MYGNVLLDGVSFDLISRMWVGQSAHLVWLHKSGSAKHAPRQPDGASGL